MKTNYRVGEKVVYVRQKYGSYPGHAAKDVSAARHGESYQYYVEKYWLVSEVKDGGQLVLITRTGKVHNVATEDPNLRKASLLERLFRSSRFPVIATHKSVKDTPQTTSSSLLPQTSFASAKPPSGN